VLKTLTEAFSQTSSGWSLPTVRDAALRPAFSTPNRGAVLPHVTKSCRQYHLMSSLILIDAREPKHSIDFLGGKNGR